MLTLTQLVCRRLRASGSSSSSLRGRPRGATARTSTSRLRWWRRRARRQRLSPRPPVALFSRRSRPATSWLSREALVFGVFAPLAIIYAAVCSRLGILSLPAAGALLAIAPVVCLIATGTGLLGVLTSVMVYVATRRKQWTARRPAFASSERARARSRGGSGHRRVLDERLRA